MVQGVSIKVQEFEYEEEKNVGYTNSFYEKFEKMGCLYFSIPRVVSFLKFCSYMLTELENSNSKRSSNSFLQHPVGRYLTLLFQEVPRKIVCL